MDFSTILSQVYFENSVQTYLIALGIVIGARIIAKIAKYILENKLAQWAKKTENKIDDLIVDVLLRPVAFLITIFGVYIAVDFIFLPEGLEKWLKVFLQILIALKVTASLSYLLSLIIDYYFDNNCNLKDNTNLRAMSKIAVKILLWIIVFILVVTNLGYNLNSLIAGLGIGGVAIALAVKGILEDIFSSASIYIDRPFQIGDYIIFGTDSGTVKSIGMKTTRLQTLQGEELVIPNASLTSNNIQNFRKLKKRRVSFQIGILYETPLAKVKKLPETIEKIIENQDNATFDRAFFTTFGDFSLIYEIVYYVDSGDIKEYLAVQQSINFELMNKFEKEKIEFAYPTQKVFVAK